MGAAFNGRGTRLLYGDAKQPPIVFDVPSDEQIIATAGRFRVTSPGFSSRFWMEHVFFRWRRRRNGRRCIGGPQSPRLVSPGQSRT